MLQKLHKHLMYCLCFGLSLVDQICFDTNCTSCVSLACHGYIRLLLPSVLIEFFTFVRILLFIETLLKLNYRGNFSKLMFFLRPQLFFLKVLRNVTFNYY